MKDLNICVLTRDFPPVPGGIANHVYEISRRLVQKGINVFLIKPRSFKNEKRYYIVEGIKIYTIPEIKTKKLRDPMSLIRMLIKIKKLNKKHNFDLIHIHGFLYECLITKFIKKIPIVFTNHESGFLDFAKNNIMSKFLYFIIRHVDFLIAPSLELVNIPIKFGYPKNKTRFIQNGVDINKFNLKVDGKKIRKKYGLSKNDFVVICARRLEPKNGVNYLIEAIPNIIKKNKNIKFLIVGGGFPENRKRFEEYIKKNKAEKNVIFTGNIEFKKMPNYYAAADIAILPSLMEATSLAGLEAMATGLALIGTKVGGIPYIIDNNKTGILIPPKNSKKIEEAILFLLRNKKRLEKMKKEARKKVEREFSWDYITEKTIEVYNETIRKTNKR